AGILRLDAYEICVAFIHAHPHPYPRMITPPGGDHIVCAVPPESELGERTGQIRTSFDEKVETGHISFLWRPGVVADNPKDIANIATPTVFPSVDQGNFQTRFL